MVVWILSGGGEAELRGLKPFLEKSFPSCTFERKLPIRKKPGPKPNKTSYGATGLSLLKQINKRLEDAEKFNQQCDIILIFDDLDCKDYNKWIKKFKDSINRVGSYKKTDQVVAFASPEIEAWIIADWNNSIASHADFKMRHERMRHWLSSNKNIDFSNPESFSRYSIEKNSCEEKLSEILIESTTIDTQDSEQKRYQKGLHTPELIQKINIEVVKKKCPIFQKFYNSLESLIINPA